MEKKDALNCNFKIHTAGNLINVPEYEKTWKSAVKVMSGAMNSVIVKFNLVDGNKPFPFDATAEPGYIYHCHVSCLRSSGTVPFVFWFSLKEKKNEPRVLKRITLTR